MNTRVRLIVALVVLATISLPVFAQDKQSSNHVNIEWSWSASGFQIYSDYSVPVNVYFSYSWTDGNGTQHSGQKKVWISANSRDTEFTGYTTSVSFSVISVTDSHGNQM